MEGTHEDRSGVSLKKPPLTPRRAALLIHAIAGLSAGAMGVAPLVAMRYWPDEWGGFVVSIMLFAVMFPPVLVAQKALLCRLFRWSGLRLIDLLGSLETGKIRDDGFFMLLMGAGLLGIAAVLVPLFSFMPADAEGSSFSVFPMAIVWYIGLVQNAAIWASAETFPDQKPEGAEEEDDGEEPATSMTHVYLAGVFNLGFAGALTFWLIQGPFEPVAGALAGATTGAAIGMRDGAGDRIAGWRLLAAGLVLADIAAVAIGFAVAQTLAAYGLADSDWITGIATFALVITMMILTGFAAERLTRRFAGGGNI